MSQTDDNMEPLRWPIAPDGYIPNSVIRCWRRRGKDLTKSGCWDEILFDSHRVREWRSDDEEDVSSRVFWFTQDEEEEEENTEDVKGRKKKMKDEKNVKDKMKAEVEGKEKMNGKKEKEPKMGRTVPLQQTYDIQTTLQNQQKTRDDGRMNVEGRSTYSSKKTVNIISRLTSCHENGPKQLREQMENMKLHEAVTSPLQSLSGSCKQTASSFIPKERPKILVEGSVVSADPVIPKQKPWKTLDTPPQKTPPSTPEDPQPQPDHGPPECSPVRDKRLHLLSPSNNNRDQAQVAWDQKVLAEYTPGYTSTTIIQPGLPSQLCCSKEPTQLENTILPTNDQSYKSMPEGKKNWHTAKLAATGDLVQSSDARQLPLLQHGQTAAPLRVVQRIQMTDTSEPASSHFHHIIPMASQQSFFTLDPCGTTQYGRLQFDWVRGHDEDELLSVSGVKIRDTAYKDGSLPR